ncbi:MAG: hypothetical protein IPJ29_13665 [Chitinophagaceae bacterium]|nr:hypothetical protein [Chitinophagaceae bacterium]
MDLNRVLNNKIMLSAFDEITQTTVKELETASNISLEQIEGLHKKVESFFKETMTDNRIRRQQKRPDTSIQKIEKYFNNLKKLIQEAEKSKGKDRFTFYICQILISLKN